MASPAGSYSRCYITNRVIQVYSALCTVMSSTYNTASQEVFRRVEPSSRSIGRFLREEVTGPLCADVFLGLSEEEQAKRHIGDVKAPTDQEVLKHTLPCFTMSHSCWRLLGRTVGTM